MGLFHATPRRRLCGAVSGIAAPGGIDYPMDVPSRAGVDLSQPGTVGAVSSELDMLVERLESELTSA